MSELGLPTAHPETLAQSIRDSLSIKTYKDYGPTFIPVGNENGLLIIVQEGRVWFPNTGIPAQISPVSVDLSNEVNERFRISGPPYLISKSSD